MKIQILSLVGLGLPLVSAVGTANVVNHCKNAVHLWSVGGSVGPEQTIKPGDGYSEELHHDPASGGISLKITRGENGLYDGSPQMNFAYTLSGDRVWYDLSDVFGDPFAGHAVSVSPGDDQCPGICWKDGKSPSGSQVKDCGSDSDITLTLCAGSC